MGEGGTMYRKNNKKRVAAYCRVSTDFSDQLNSLATQRSYFNDYINDHEEWELIEIYYDEGITGTSTKHRKGFNRMIQDCEDGKIDTILTKEVSRFARNTVDTLTYTRKLSQLGVNVIFMNDGIDTSDKDGELRLSIMSSIAQEESRKISERIKWGLKRRMEKGDVIGKRKIYGYKIVDNQYEIIPEEAEIVRRIFHEYYYDKKGSTLIAQGLNADNIPSATGKTWTSCSVLIVLKNEKYCGDLTQWKNVTESYLTKRRLKNDGSNPDTPMITLQDHHIGIVSHEVWEGVQSEIARRGKSISEGRRHSNKYWFSGKVSCGKCGKPFSLSGATKSDTHRLTLRCTNRAYYGDTPTTSHNGDIIGCDNKTILVESVERCIKYVLQRIQVSKSEIEKQFWADICEIQKAQNPVDVAIFEKEVESLKQKKKNAIDLMLEGLISKDDLAEQNQFYTQRIEELNEKIYAGTNAAAIFEKQIEKIKEQISIIKATDTFDIENSNLYGDIVDRIIVQNNRLVDVYLNFMPFGYRIEYTLIKPNKYREFDVIISSCEIIS